MNDAISLLRALKGAPISCLVALHFSNRAVGNKWLVTATGYKANSIIDAMDALVELGHAVRVSRYSGWQLTDKGSQLPLFATLKNEVDLINLPSCSCSLIDRELLLPSSLKLQLQQEREVDLINLPPAYALLIPYFLDRIGPANTVLENALQHAADAGDDPAAIATRIEEWLAYLGSEKAKGIQNPGAFVAKQITNGQSTPAWFSSWLTRERGPKHFGHDWREWLAEHGYCVRCASEPCQCEKSEEQHESINNT